MKRALGRGGGPIYKHRDFHSLLERERALADRHNRFFSLIEFDLAESRPSQAQVTVLLNALLKRLRKTDIVGWIGRWRVGVILPDTPSAGAGVLAEHICREVAGRLARPLFKVCTYPVDEDQGIPVNEEAPARALPEPRVARDPPARVEPDLVNGILFGRPPYWKRMLDVLGGGVALAALSPVMLLVAVVIKSVSKGPVLFRQERVGYLGKPFICWKFRTMLVNADTGMHQAHFKNLMQNDTPMTKLDHKDDPRLIPFGRYLRATGVDELPQLFNVLRGEMSLVGPRPSIRYEYEGFQRWQKNRCDTLPGLTGLWQTSGKNRTTFLEMMRLDIAYAHRKTLTLDLMMLVKTVPAVWDEVMTAIRRNRRRSCKTLSTSGS